MGLSFEGQFKTENDILKVGNFAERLRGHNTIN